MGNRNKAKRTASPTQVLNYIKPWFPNARRTPLKGGADTGDINGITRHVLQGVAIQCKNAKTFKLSEWLNAAGAQAKSLTDEAWLLAHNLEEPPESIGVVVFKRPGVGEKNLGKTYVLMELDDLITLLTQADYK